MPFSGIGIGAIAEVDFSQLLDDLFGSATKAFSSRTLGDAESRKRNLKTRRLQNTGGTQFEAARPTATSIRSATDQGPLQPSGTRKFVIPRERRRRRGLVAEFNLGGQEGTGVNLGTGATFSI